MHHRDVHAGTVEHQLQRLINQTDRQQRAVDQTTGLQQHDPGGDPHQDRGPERQQHQNHQQVALPRRQVGQQIGQRVGQQQADGSNHQAHPEGAGKNIQVDGLVRCGSCQLTEIVDAMVQGSQQVIGGDIAVIAADDLPVGGVAPALIKAFQRIFIGGRLALEGQRAGGFRHQAAVACQFHVQAFRQVTQGLLLARIGQVQAQRLIRRLGGQGFAIPLLQGCHGARQ